MADLTTAKTEDLEQYHETMRSLALRKTLSQLDETEWAVVLRELERRGRVRVVGSYDKLGEALIVPTGKE